MQLVDSGRGRQFDCRQISMSKSSEKVESRIGADIVTDADCDGVLVAGGQNLLSSLTVNHAVQVALKVIECKY